MAKVKFDKEKASTLITELTNLQTNINSCLSNINSCGLWKDPYSSDLVVWDTVYYTETNIVDGVSVSELKSKQVKTYPHTSKVQNYNDALESIQSKATSLKTTSGKISKVITALKTVSELVEEFENTPNLTLSAELGDAADYNFNFLEKFGGTGSASLKGPMGYLGSVWDRIDITEFNRLGEDIIPTVDDEIPEKIIDFDGDGKISISDYMKSFVKDSVNEDGIVVINGQELGELSSLTFTTFLTKTDPEFLEEIELGIEQDLHVVVDLAGSLATLVGMPLKPSNEGEEGDSESVAGGVLMDSVLAGVPNVLLQTNVSLESLMGRLTEEERLLFEEQTAGMTEQQKIEEFQNRFSHAQQHLGKIPPHGDVETEVPTTPEGFEVVVEGANTALGALTDAVDDVQGSSEPPTIPGKTEDLNGFVNNNKPYNDVYQKVEDKGYGNGGNGGNGGYGNGNNGGGGHGGGGHGEGGHGGGGNGGHTPTTTPQTEAPTQPQTQPATEVPTQPKTQPVTEPPKHTPAPPPKHEEKTELELISRGDDSSFEMPILKDDTVVEEDKVSSAGAGLLGAAGVGAGLLNGGGNAAPAIPSVDLGVTPPPAPTPSTMTTPTTPSTPTTTVQNNTPMAGATPDMDDMITSQTPGAQQGNSNNSTHASRTTADTSSEGITKGKYSSSGNSSSSSTSKQSKETYTKDGEFKDDKDDNTVQNKVDPTKPEGVLGEASYAELIAKEEKQIKVATAITASSMAVSIALSLASIIDVIVLVLLLLAAILAYSVFRTKKKKNIKRLEALIRIEKIKKEETEAAVKEEVSSEETSEETTEIEEEAKSENDVEEKNGSDKDDTENETEVSKIKEVEEIVTEQKEFQSAEEVIYGEMPQRTEEDNETKEEMDSTKE